MSNRAAPLSRRQAGWLLALILVAGAALYVVPIWWGLPFQTATWAFDEIKPSHVGSRWPILYPPAHRQLLAALFAGADRLAALTGRPALYSQNLLLVSRALSSLLACLTALLVYRCARRLSDRATSLLSVAAVAFGTNYVFYATTANLDMPYVFWFTLSLLFFLRCLEHRHWSDHVLFAVCGALAIATKTQAYALYLVAPFALVLNLRRSEDPFWSSLWRALFDRRILEAAGACIAVTLLVFGELRGSGELRGHFAALTALDFEDYRTVAMSPRGLFKLATETVRLLSFVLGAPVLLASVAGLVMAVARPRSHVRLLSTLLFVAPYWLVFVAATGFNYDRHYLPIAIVLALFAGKALASLAAAGPPLRPLRLTAVGLALAYAAWGGVSVDLMLLGDARYEAERWMDANGLYGKTVGLGAKERLPRGIPAFGIEHFARSRRGEAGTNPNVWHNCLTLKRLDVEYLIPDTPEEMRGVGLNYREHRRFRNAAWAPLLNPEGVSAYASNVVKPSRDIVVFRRTDEECVDSAIVPRTLEELRRHRDPERREELARAIFESPSVRSVSLAGDALQGVRMHRNGWTVGTIPAAIAAQNLGWRDEQPEVRLRLSRPRAPYPVTVFLDDGEQRRSLVFAKPGERVVPLATLAPGRNSLTILWTDKSFLDQDGKLRGVRVMPTAWPPGPEERLQQLRAVLRGLHEGTVDEIVRPELARAIRRGGVDDPIEVEEDALMVGAWDNCWTVDTEQAGVLVRNAGERSARVQLVLSCDDRQASEPKVAFVDGGARLWRFELDCTSREPRVATLDRLAPGAERLYLLWSDRARPTPVSPKRMLGVHLKEVRLVSEETKAEAP